jgi:glycosyltransferase involved in cell wall biosynthesis
MPLVSIIVPVYKVEKYLDRCMESLLNQTLTDIEIILVEDGSPDGCPGMCDEYESKDSRVKVVHKQNGGLGLARNSGMEHATGEFIGFVDSDDFVETTMYETLYKTSQEYGVDTVYCNCAFYKDDKSIVVREDIKTTMVLKTQDAVDDFLLDMVGPLPSYPSDVKYMMSVWRAIYKREFLWQNKIQFDSERVIVSEDLVFHVNYLSKVNSVALIPSAFYYYCYNGSSLTKTYYDGKYEKLKHFLTIIKTMLEKRYPENLYRVRHQRLSLLYLRNILKDELSVAPSYMKLLRRIKSILSEPYWAKQFEGYPYKDLPLKHRLFFVAVKKRMAVALSLMSTLENKQK